MRILMIQPNYHAGGAEIAGNWPPGWAAYVGGALKGAGYENRQFLDAMAFNVEDDACEEKIRAAKPDVVMATAITPMIYKAQNTLKIAKEAAPNASRSSAASIRRSCTRRSLRSALDRLHRPRRRRRDHRRAHESIESGTDEHDRAQDPGIAYLEDGKLVATPARPVIANLDSLTPDWSLLHWDKYIYIPLNTRVAVPNFARGCPFTCRFCSQWKFWRKYRVRDPKKFVDEIETLVNEYKVGFFILADEEPTIHRRKFVAMCEELIARKIKVHGASTRA